MAKIKVIYDWFGPAGPMVNNHVPNIFQIAGAMHGVRIDQWRNYYVPHVAHHVFPYVDGYEFAPSFTVKEDDVFVYEFLMFWEQPVDAMFDSLHGLIERAQIGTNGLLMESIRSRNGYILLECTAEAFVDPLTFMRMHAYFESRGIPLNKVIYQTGCANAEAVYNAFCEQQNIVHERRMKVIFFEWVEWELAKKCAQEPIYPTPNDFQSVYKDFMVLNRRFRQHRGDLLLTFYKHNLLEKSFFGMPLYNPDQQNLTWKDSANLTLLERLELNYGDLDIIQSMLPLKFDNVEDVNEMVHDHDRKLTYWYNHSLISLVTETTFHLDQISTTEKTFKPIRYKHPFIMVGSAHALAHLRKGGYKTFSDFWDESYDSMDNPDFRMIAIGKLCKEISEWSESQKREFYEKSRPIVEHNYNLLRERWPNNMPNRFWHNLRDSHA
jgi:hypothetical protein